MSDFKLVFLFLLIIVSDQAEKAEKTAVKNGGKVLVFVNTWIQHRQSGMKGGRYLLLEGFKDRILQGKYFFTKVIKS